MRRQRPSMVRGFSEKCFEVCEDLLDWIEVRRVRRQKQEMGASSANGAADRAAFVRAEVIHDNDVAGAQHRHFSSLVGVGVIARKLTYGNSVAIPAIAKTKKYEAISEGIVADETVSGEPVCEANSLLSGKKTGNFAKSLA